MCPAGITCSTGLGKGLTLHFFPLYMTLMVELYRKKKQLIMKRNKKILLPLGFKSCRNICEILENSKLIRGRDGGSSHCCPPPPPTHQVPQLFTMCYHKCKPITEFRIFQSRGGRWHCVKVKVFTRLSCLFLPPGVGCLLKMAYKRWGGGGGAGHPRAALAMPLTETFQTSLKWK